MEKRLANNMENHSLNNIEEIKKKNNPCPNCINPNIKKFKPLTSQINLEEVNNRFGKCECGKRHLDSIMTHVAKIMLDHNIPIVGSNLRNSGTPLVEFGFSDNNTNSNNNDTRNTNTFNNNSNEPYLKENSLIILSKNITKECALDIYKNVSEIKGILKGDVNKTVGIKEVFDNSDFDFKDFYASTNINSKLNSLENEYELLVGSDLRSDIVNTPADPIIISKYQHKMHLEFSKSLEIKINKLYNKLSQYSFEEISNLKVLDGTCGTGALGIFALKFGVKKLVFNDVWRPAIETTKNNLVINQIIAKEELKSFELLENKILEDNWNNEYNTDNKENAKNTGNNKVNWSNAKNNIEIYNLTVEEFIGFWKAKTSKKFNLGIIDLFPGVNPDKVKKSYAEICENVIII
ncbi:MAG: 50S ribosomal protein L11 methyltransferase [Methanobacteriaceae archaeon]